MAALRALRFAILMFALAVGAAHATGPASDRAEPEPTVPPKPGGDGSRFVGPYIGASVGYACCGADQVGIRYKDVLARGPQMQIKGALASARLGWRTRVNEQILGVELEAEFGDIADRRTAKGITAHSRITNIVTLKGIASIHATDNMLIYLTAGPASGRSHYEVSNFISLARTARFPGYLVGFGVELARDSDWSLRGEYLVYEFGRNRVEGAGRSSEATPTFHALRVGINYAF